MIDQLSLVAVYPEIFLLVMTCVIALVDLALLAQGDEVLIPAREYKNRHASILLPLEAACEAMIAAESAGA